MHFATAYILILQAAERVADQPDPSEGVGFTVPFELVAIATGVLVTFGMVYLVRRMLAGKGQ